MAISKGHTFTANEEVDHSKLNNLVDNATISDGAITSGKIAGSAITSAKIAAGAISNTAISSTAGISLSKLESATDANPRVLIVGSDSKPAYQDVSGDATIDATGALTIASDAVETAMVADSAITASKIAHNSIDSDRLQANAVGASELADDAVDTAAVADGAITNAKLASNPTITTFTSSGTWTKPTGCNLVHVFVAAGGGGEVSKGGADGGEGAICEVWLDVSSDTTISVTVGSGGAGGAYVYSGAYSGGNGGNSSFGSKIVCTGGQGGQYNSSNGNQTDGADGTITAHTTDSAKKLVSSDFATYNYGKGGQGGNNGSDGTDGNDGIVIIRVIG